MNTFWIMYCYLYNITIWKTQRYILTDLYGEENNFRKFLAIFYEIIGTIWIQ